METAGLQEYTRCRGLGASKVWGVGLVFGLTAWGFRVVKGRENRVKDCSDTSLTYEFMRTPGAPALASNLNLWPQTHKQNL